MNRKYWVPGIETWNANQYRNWTKSVTLHRWIVMGVLTDRGYYTRNIWNRILSSEGLERGSPYGLHSGLWLFSDCYLWKLRWLVWHWLENKPTNITVLHVGASGATIRVSGLLTEDIINPPKQPIFYLNCMSWWMIKQVIWMGSNEHS